MGQENKTECVACEEMLDDDEVTYCPTCDAPICHSCLKDDGTCNACPDEDND